MRQRFVECYNIFGRKNMKYALISGAESGLAKAAISELDKLDYTIFCLDIVYKEISVNGNKHFVPLDITNDQSICQAFEYVSKITDTLDIVSNFAGIVILGSLVELPFDTLDRIMKINLLGTYKINNKFFPLIKKVKGRIINISSEYGKICGIPFHGYYGISKHAIETYNDSLRRELAGSGVSVVCIRPGAFKTNMQAGITKQFEEMVNQTKMYREPLEKMKGMMTGELEKAKPTTIFAKTFAKAVEAKKPKRYYHVNNSFKMKLLNILPTGVQDWAFKKYL